jgi:hypothetical protein
MTPKGLAAFRAKLKREIRDRAIAAGTEKPKSNRDFEVWHQAQAERDQRRARRIARAERQGKPFISEADAEQPEE